MMKVLHIISDLSGGGGGVCLLNFAAQANRVIEQRHDILAVGKIYWDEIDVPCALTTHESHGNLGDAARFVKNGNYDLLQWHWWEEIPLMRELSKLNGPKRIIGCDVYPSEPKHTLTDFEIKYADLIVCDGLDTLMAYPSIPVEKKCFIVGGGPLMPYLNTGVTRQHRRIGRGSVLTEKKCPIDMIDSFAGMKVDAEFYVYGEGPLRQRFKNDARRLEIEHRVHLEGWHKDYPTRMSQLDLFVYELPEKSYASSELVLQGAMAAKVPVVILPSLGTRWMFQHEKTALVAKNRVELIKYAERLWNNPNEASALAQNAYNKAWLDYGTHNMVKGYLSSYIGLFRCKH